MNADFVVNNKDVSEYFRIYLTNPVNLLEFTRFFFKFVQKSTFSVNWHHILIADKLNQIFENKHESNHIIFNIPPRHTKTELAVINFSALGFALNPKAEFMHFSSSDSLVTRNTMIIRNIMESELYKSIFPETKLINNAKASISTSVGGVFYTAPFLGQITGFGCGKLGSKQFAGAMIIDDPIKTQDALSETIREKVNFTWANTLISRKNDQNTPVIVVGQRVHDRDFCGFLIEEEGTLEEGGRWDVVRIPAIINENTDNESAIWEERISLAVLKKQRELDGWVFSTQYMQDPKPIEGMLFHESTTKYYDELPESPDYVHIQIDPADEGTDRLCSAVYLIKNNNIFVSDVIYTEDSSELTIPRIINQIKTSGASTAAIESNAGWSLFRKEIKRQVGELDLATLVISINSKTNKEARIFMHAPSILHHFYYSKNGNSEYKKFLKDKHRYLKMVKDQDDDGVDTDTASCAFLKRNGIIPVI